MTGLQAPLSTLRLAPRDALRMTRGQSGLLTPLLLMTFTFTLCAVSRRTRVLYFPFRQTTPLSSMGKETQGTKSGYSNQSVCNPWSGFEVCCNVVDTFQYAPSRSIDLISGSIELLPRKSVTALRQDGHE